MAKKLTYRDAGVDIDAMDRALRQVRTLARETATRGVLSDIGSFGGLFWPEASAETVLVASVDGVGTKLKVAIDAGVHDTVGADLVNHCVNDILVQGAEPLFFMDYFATGKLAPEVMVDVVRGVARACSENGCALLGGETAEMPGFYAAGDYDIAGFIVGRVNRSQLITGESIRPGDVLLGLPSSGLQTNGYSLARKILLEIQGLALGDEFPGTPGRTVADTLLETHRSFLSPVRDLLRDGVIRGLAHITGGGLTDNLPRVLPAGTGAEVDLDAWPLPTLFARLQEWGGVALDEMLRTFNMGIGLVLVVSEAQSGEVVSRLEGAGEVVYRIGRTVAGDAVVTYRGTPSP